MTDAVAHLGPVFDITSVHITREHSAVVAVVADTEALREWLWGTRRIAKGKAMGSRFVLSVDGVNIEARRVFARPVVDVFRCMRLTITTGPADTKAAVLGRKVGKRVWSAELKRVPVVSKKQAELIPEKPKAKRVRAEWEAKP